MTLPVYSTIVYPQNRFTLFCPCFVSLNCLTSISERLILSWYIFVVLERFWSKQLSPVTLSKLSDKETGSTIFSFQSAGRDWYKQWLISCMALVQHTFLFVFSSNMHFQLLVWLFNSKALTHRFNVTISETILTKWSSPVWTVWKRHEASTDEMLEDSKKDRILGLFFEVMNCCFRHFV